MRILPIILAATWLVAGTAASAAITVYTSQAAFLAATSAAAVDTFENFNITDATPSPINRTVGSYSYTAAVSTTSFFGAGTNIDHWLSTNTATDTITFSGLTGGVKGFGGLFFTSDIAGAFAAGGVTLSATDASGTVNQVIANSNTSSFLGFVTDGAFTTVTLASVTAAAPIWPTVNNLTLTSGSTVVPGVPEPASWALMIAGFGLTGAAMRRRTAVVA